MALGPQQGLVGRPRHLNKEQLFKCFAAEHRVSAQHWAKPMQVIQPCVLQHARLLSMALPHTRPVLSTAPAQHQPGIHPYCQVGPMTRTGTAARFLSLFYKATGLCQGSWSTWRTSMLQRFFHFESGWHAPMAKGICPRGSSRLQCGCRPKPPEGDSTRIQVLVKQRKAVAS